MCNSWGVIIHELFLLKSSPSDHCWVEPFSRYDRPAMGKNKLMGHSVIRFVLQFALRSEVWNINLYLALYKVAFTFVGCVYVSRMGELHVKQEHIYKYAKKPCSEQCKLVLHRLPPCESWGYLVAPFHDTCELVARLSSVGPWSLRVYLVTVGPTRVALPAAAHVATDKHWPLCSSYSAGHSWIMPPSAAVPCCPSLSHPCTPCCCQRLHCIQMGLIFKTCPKWLWYDTGTMFFCSEVRVPMFHVKS